MNTTIYQITLRGRDYTVRQHNEWTDSTWIRPHQNAQFRIEGQRGAIGYVQLHRYEDKVECGQLQGIYHLDLVEENEVLSEFQRVGII